MTNHPFVNEPLLELRRSSVRSALGDALAAVELRLPSRVPVLIGGERRRAEDDISTDPGLPERVVATVARTTPDEVDAAVAAAAAGARAWAQVPAEQRARVLLGAAGVLRRRRMELTALALRECAKPWREADADVCEAIDFLEYYARAAVRLEAGAPLVQLPGERNTLRYVPRGVVAVIAPWNFPIAIPAGMVAAGLATGNAVVLKPAEQAPACAWALVQALLEGGVPPAALHLLPGEGDVGARLVEHPGVHTIAFTGSAAVGREILARAAVVPDGQRHIKRVVAELGGKNAILVDADADLDDAIPALAYSAFGFAGQKCSAAARVLVHEQVAGVVAERMRGILDTLVVDQAARFGVDVPPVIEWAARARLEQAIAAADGAGAEVARGEPGPATGWFVAPTIVLGAPADAAVVREELFGPVVTIEPVRDLDEACAIVDALPVALTGGVFSRNPATVERVARLLPVGNLYVNRHITGAMVGRQPFGGNRLSGTGTKAGGPGYLEHFVEPRVVTESTVRHGLVVEA